MIKNSGEKLSFFKKNYVFPTQEMIYWMEVSEHILKKLSRVGFEPPSFDHLYALTAHT